MAALSTAPAWTQVAPVAAQVTAESAGTRAEASKRPESDTAALSPKAILWTDPGDIKALNLFYGSGGKEHEPKLPVTFAQEDVKGSSPKFELKDADGKKWKGKVGPEARPEVAAARLLWAVGYTTNENYLVKDLKIEGLPQHLARGDEFREPDGGMREVRLQRGPHGADKVGDWSWVHNPFKGTREFNGLRVMMALVNNWDLKDANNARYESKKTGEILYEVTDVGATFGTTGRAYSNKAKGKLKIYEKTKFITHKHKKYVDFGIVSRPGILFAIFDTPYYLVEIKRRWIGKHIPREDAKWIGSLLAQLTPDQIRDAFRAAGYGPDDVEGFTKAVQSRIAQLADL